MYYFKMQSCPSVLGLRAKWNYFDKNILCNFLFLSNCLAVVAADVKLLVKSQQHLVCFKALFNIRLGTRVNIHSSLQLMSMSFTEHNSQPVLLV